MATVRVLVVSADPLARAGLAALLQEQPEIEMVGRAGLQERPAELVDLHRPDVVLLDAGWDSEDALEHARELSAGAAPLALLLPDEELAARGWDAGARGLLARNADVHRLVAALAALAAGLTVFDPPFAPAQLRKAPQPVVPAPSPDNPPTLAEPLTGRELEVLRLMADGLPNKTIAVRLQISEHTVKFHVNAILGKLGAASRTEAVVNATRLGLILL